MTHALSECYLFDHLRIAVLTGCLDSFIPLAQFTIGQNKVEYCNRHRYHLEVIREVRKKYRNGRSHADGFTWSRLEHLLDMVESGIYQWIWTVGADTLITNMTVTLDSIIAKADNPVAERAPFPRFIEPKQTAVPNGIVKWIPPKDHKTTGKKHLIICGECLSSPQADSFIVRCSPETASYLRDILSHYDQYKTHPWVEQRVMMDLLYKYASITHIVPQWVMNSYNYSRWAHLRQEYRNGRDCYGNRGDWQPGDFLIHWPNASLDERGRYYQQFEPQIIR